MDLTTNGVVITDAIKFVQTNKEKLMTMVDKESEEPDYDDDRVRRKARSGTGEQEKQQIKFFEPPLGYLHNITSYHMISKYSRFIANLDVFISFSCNKAHRL